MFPAEKGILGGESDERRAAVLAAPEARVVPCRAFIEENQEASKEHLDSDPSVRGAIEIVFGRMDELPEQRKAAFYCLLTVGNLRQGAGVWMSLLLWCVGLCLGHTLLCLLTPSNI